MVYIAYIDKINRKEHTTLNMHYRIEQCFAVHVVQCCQQYFLTLLHLSDEQPGQHSIVEFCYTKRFVAYV